MKSKRAARLAEYGFGAIHVVGNWYLCRMYSKHSAHHIGKHIWFIYNLKDDPNHVEFTTKVYKFPEGTKFRL